MSRIVEDVKRIRERNKNIFPDCGLSEPWYVKAMYFRLPTVIIPIGMSIEPYGEALFIEVEASVREIAKKVYNSLANIFYRI